MEFLVELFFFLQGNFPEERQAIQAVPLICQISYKNLSLALTEINLSASGVIYAMHAYEMYISTLYMIKSEFHQLHSSLSSSDHF